MRSRSIRELSYGKEVWKNLEKLINRGKDRSRVFEDWLDLMMAAYLSLTDNVQRPDFADKFKANKLDGPYEDRYMEIVARYEDDRPKGDRAIDYLSNAHAELVKETIEHQFDVLGEVYEAMISFGEHGQFFTPSPITDMMAKIVQPEKAETVLDPACGSGRTLLSAAKVSPDATLYGIDVDSRCAKMCALNILLLDLNGIVIWGDALSMKYYRQWTILKGRFISESEVENKVQEKVTKAVQGQRDLFAA